MLFLVTMICMAFVSTVIGVKSPVLQWMLMPLKALERVRDKRLLGGAALPMPSLLQLSPPPPPPQ